MVMSSCQRNSCHWITVSFCQAPPMSNFSVVHLVLCVAGLHVWHKQIWPAAQHHCGRKRREQVSHAAAVAEMPDDYVVPNARMHGCEYAHIVMLADALL
jgi:hypothetical protein